MKFTNDVPKFTASDAEIDANIKDADIPALLVTCAHLTGDYSLLRDEWRPVMEYGVAISGMTPDTEAEVRAECAARLKSFRDAGGETHAAATAEEIRTVANWMMPEMGEKMDAFIPLNHEEAVLNGFDLRRPRWNKARLAPEREFSVAIIGAGEAGMLTAMRLKEAGVPFTIFEKNPEVGGTWFENHYPGARVDCNSFFYSFACMRGLWEDFYGHGADVLEYLKAVADEWGIRDNIVFNAEVTECRWNEATNQWDLTIDHQGQTLNHNSNMLVSAVGQLNRPMMPDIEGQELFTGPSFHSARWDHDICYEGKRVGVIGTGATALQFIPQLAKTAENVTVFARTTPWLLPTPLLHEKVPEGLKWLMVNVPTYSMWYRVTLAIPGAVGMLDGVKVDPDYPPTEKAVSAMNDQARQAITDWMEAQIEDRPDLREHLIPNSSPLGGKRIIRDNGAWAKTLRRNNVVMNRKGIAEITETGIRDQDGHEHEFDMIVYGTGFQASKFLMPMQVYGHDGVSLHDMWDGDARAYLGATVPNFPNLFMIYGPNTNQVVHGGSAFLWSEFTVKYILDAARTLLESEARSIEVKEKVYWNYNERIDAANRLRAWGFSKVNSWYKNEKGRVTQNYPFTSAELWQRSHEVSLTDYEIS
ncbi:NAD(P)/FAD-dependent oxidoreductase [Ruegeria sp. Ofav3-42]|uniref:flavin-containing monooxygenase n=1 Tax=Ruegeria sp. Ofav3-42 TaxID=2917759 RepID=UPI001EF6A96E|nr:NAD(P)/FAD-dependent oxidoreductase [Ruegeria sp. Ofav3-42]MCG7522440.1 NAD(P)/FAD-dependent oxidoreductase [Ruegeria sp. Ofav3-42]